VLAVNTLLVLLQVRGQAGFRVNAPVAASARVAVVVAYSVWALVLMGLRTGAAPLWVGMVVTAVLATPPYWVVHRRHDPSHAPARAPGHVERLWGYHEDVHLLVVAGDAQWAALVAQTVAR
jgi:hypothetical protein